jgi:hypothetical protein
MSSQLALNQEKAAQAFEDGMNLIQDIGGWSEVSSTSDITVYQRPTDSGINAVKTESFFNKPFADMAEYCWSHWKELELSLWDVIRHIDYVQEFEDGSRIRVERTRNFGPVSPREGYLYYSKQQLDECTIVLLATSSPMEFQVSEDHVKGELRFGMQIFEAVAGDLNKTHLITIDQADPKGSLPNFVVNEVNMDRGKFYEALVIKLKGL